MPTADIRSGQALVIVRWAIVLLAALLVALFAVRNAAVQAWAEGDPQRAVSAWPGHPDAEISLGMIEIAEAMRDRRPVSPSVIRRVEQAALRAPLAPEPFLVHGVRADLAGDSLAAERDFAAAQRRDPRSLAAAYFLADRYVRRGDVEHGLTQLALLARLAPGGASSVAPYLASYAAKPANWPQLRALFRAEPALGDAALQALATNPASAPAILALADARQRSPSAPWLQTLLARLVEARHYGQAQAIWAAVSNVRVGPGTLLFNGGFSESVAPAPFNWELSSSTAGLAERRPGGGLHVMFYGQEDGTLARQLLVLPAGSYRLSLSVQPGSSNAESLYWTVRCAAGNAELGRVRLDQAASGWTFEVPASCPAQWLELVGSAPDVPRQSDVTIANLGLAQGNGR
jgi:hypothetical protein